MNNETLYCLHKGCRYAETKRPFTGSRFLINHYRQSHDSVEAGRRAVERQRLDAVKQAAEEDSPQGELTKAGVETLVPDMEIGVTVVAVEGVVGYLNSRIDQLTQQAESIQHRLTTAEAELVFTTDELNRCKAARDAYNLPSQVSHHKQE